MLVLLPPSETKRDGGDGPPLRLDALSHPALDGVRKALVEELVELAAVAATELVVDLRSGSYAALGRVAGAVTVNVLAERPDGSRSVVSHFNKAHKGRLARVLASSRAEPSDAAGIAAIARRAGMRVERKGNALEIILPA